MTQLGGVKKGMMINTIPKNKKLRQRAKLIKKIIKKSRIKSNLLFLLEVQVTDYGHYLDKTFQSNLVKLLELIALSKNFVKI